VLLYFILSACKQSEYVNNEKKICIQCPENSHTTNYTATSSDDCICNEGYVGSPIDGVACEGNNYQGRIQGGGGGGAPGARPPKIGKIWFFGVKSWFFTRNTPNIFAPPSARRNFFLSALPLTWNPGSAPDYISGRLNLFISVSKWLVFNVTWVSFQLCHGDNSSDEKKLPALY
jgi:hypothetical protein